MRLGAALTPFKGGGYGAPLHLVPDVLKERLQAEGLLDDSPSPKPLRIAFEARPRAGFLSIHRAHPLTGVLAETFLENALDDGARQDDPATLPRCGVWDTDAVDAVTTLLLLRIRHRLHSRGRLGAGVQHGRGGGRDRLCRRDADRRLGMRPSPCSRQPAAR